MKAENSEFSARQGSYYDAIVVIIADFGNTGNEPEALRQALEYYGYTVLKRNIGRPDDVILAEQFASYIACYK
jgi:hypothetical protein